MAYRIFLAGASGAIGQRLIPQLLAAGHQVTGTTRNADRAAKLGTLGVEPAVVDVFDADALSRWMRAARPDIVVHQLTDLPAGLDPSRMAEAVVGNARIREEGTRNLVAAAVASGVRRMVAQSIAWAFAPGSEPHAEADPLDSGASGNRGISVGGVIALETAVLNAPFAGIVLRYGQLYGPGTGADTPAGASPLHVDAAAYAALLALDKGAPGIFNIAESNEAVSTRKAAEELGWRADFRLPA
ncbi:MULTISPECIES: NAD(P)-dependent oxidoreductase [unclassified Mesorhizobium]|uniref:NAD-dependent epimerase/dehydratase family protein n=1 Tax=unclassified Mesorhizobium TaxID=325217 RepID=UPI000FD857BF|nr:MULTISPECIES: NAD(P)-dependent oxidoreductase [unclassified Mesorhizobium]TGR48757.1 NAD(P)-dependent oxidoreductase [bacterium M00.F.Ca.ET.199.01.1.1]TGU37798.1 NAD(P)-dependent oxidoreductase [bacterium M00.F.Ca.ET.156.01.1.1]TGV88785.1 NAD(P)-dependent oxidoreductase [Mesorhizobium sp. M00.F.Ca.ET.149.01.1.1]TGR30445.1 NAD(P)-dependent oxidoreductase [Mesorhizobium sp. M8A.F.Ca.ET.202.01.1.1]TGR31173.1 NAD(P)-dependent oxidoreductase [Mesorhizobium sp. M8A.F.Ca.ET.197.01.1.1]